MDEPLPTNQNIQPSLEDQIKVAERDKYLAEIDKVKAEREKIDFELLEAKKEAKTNWFFRKESFAKLITVIIVLVSFLGFFIPNVILPAFNKENIELSRQNTITKDSLYQQEKALKKQQVALNIKVRTIDSLNRNLILLQNQVLAEKTALDTVNKRFKTVSDLLAKSKSLRNSTEIQKANKKLKRSIEDYNKISKLESDRRTTTATTGSSSATLGFSSISSPWATLLQGNKGDLLKFAKSTIEAASASSYGNYHINLTWAVNDAFNASHGYVSQLKIKIISEDRKKAVTGFISSINNNYKDIFSVLLPIGTYSIVIDYPHYTVKDGFTFKVEQPNDINIVPTIEIPIEEK